MGQGSLFLPPSGSSPILPSLSGHTGHICSLSPGITLQSSSQGSWTIPHVCSSSFTALCMGPTRREPCPTPSSQARLKRHTAWGPALPYACSQLWACGSIMHPHRLGEDASQVQDPGDTPQREEKTELNLELPEVFREIS